MVHEVPVRNLPNWPDCIFHGFLYRPLPFLPLCLCLSCSLCLDALCHFRGSKSHSSFKDQLTGHFPHEASIILALDSLHALSLHHPPQLGIRALWE